MTRKLRFRTPCKCQNGHHAFLFYSVKFGEVHKPTFVVESACKCNTGEFGEGFDQCAPDEQWTGLNDKNGIPIFEGDIVHWHVNKRDIKAPVYWDEQQACFWMGKEIGGPGKGLLVLNDWMRGYYEVLGNIHQNPEMLGE